jgi:hypothetical protein
MNAACMRHKLRYDDTRNYNEYCTKNPHALRIMHHLALLNRPDVTACHVTSPNRLQKRRHCPSVQPQLPACKHSLIILFLRRQRSSSSTALLRLSALEHAARHVRMPVSLQPLSSSRKREKPNDLSPDNGAAEERQQQTTSSTVSVRT